MAANRYVSFYEVRLVDTDLLVRLGSGLDSDVLQLSLDAPSIRVCMPETAGTGSEVRVRFGLAELTDEGLTPIQGDEFEMRGARGRMLGLGSGTLKALASRWRAGESERALLATIGPSWLRIGAGGIAAVAAADARAAFGADVAPEDVEQVWVYVEMDPSQLDAFAALMAASEAEAVRDLDSESSHHG